VSAIGCTFAMVLNAVGMAAAPGAALPVYEGHYPHEQIECRSFLELEPVAKQIAQRGGSRATELFDELTTAAPIVKREDALIAFVCKTGDCDAENAAVAISLKGTLIAMCLYSKDGRHGALADQVRWTGEKLDRLMPYDKDRKGCPHDDDEFLVDYARAIAPA
jgi:hypothetical protein